MTRIKQLAAVAVLVAAGIGGAGLVQPAEAQMESAECADTSGTLCGTLTSTICFNLVFFTVCKSATENYYEAGKDEKEEDLAEVT